MRTELRSRETRAVRAVALTGFLVVSAVSGTARADDSTTNAETLFQQSRALVDAGRYAEACPKLEASYQLEPAVGTQFNLADCYEHLGRTASAYVTFRQVASIARAAGKFERERSAKERAAALEPRLARVRFLVQAPAPGLEIRVDGALVDKATWSEPLPVDPGAHRVRAAAPGRSAWEVMLEVKDSRSADVAIPELVDPTPKAPIVATPGGGSGQKTIAIVTGGVGLAGLAVGTIAGAIALSQRSSAERACPTDVYHFRCPTEDGAASWSSAGTAGNVSTVAFIVGGVALTGAAVLWFTAPSSRTRVAATPSGVRLEGDF